MRTPLLQSLTLTGLVLLGTAVPFTLGAMLAFAPVEAPAAARALNPVPAAALLQSRDPAPLPLPPPTRRRVLDETRRVRRAGLADPARPRTGLSGLAPS